MNRIYNLSDLLFVPSYSELFPMTILEAANSFKPVLVRDLELYRGILFDDRDCYAKGNAVAEFDAAIKRFHEDRAFYDHYVEGVKQISDYYSKDRLRGIWKEYYQRIYNKWKDNKKKRLKMKWQLEDA